MSALHNLPAAVSADGEQVEQGPAATVQGWARRDAGPAGAATRHKSAPAHPAGLSFSAIAAAAVLITGGIMLAPTHAHSAEVQLPMLEAYEPAEQLPETGGDDAVTLLTAGSAVSVSLGVLAVLASVAQRQPAYRRRAVRHGR